MGKRTVDRAQLLIGNWQSPSAPNEGPIRPIDGLVGQDLGEGGSAAQPTPLQDRESRAVPMEGVGGSSHTAPTEGGFCPSTGGSNKPTVTRHKDSWQGLGWPGEQHGIHN